MLPSTRVKHSSRSLQKWALLGTCTRSNLLLVRHDLVTELWAEDIRECCSPYHLDLSCLVICSDSAATHRSYSGQVTTLQDIRSLSQCWYAAILRQFTVLTEDRGLWCVGMWWWQWQYVGTIFAIPAMWWPGGVADTTQHWLLIGREFAQLSSDWLAADPEVTPGHGTLGHVTWCWQDIFISSHIPRTLATWQISGVQHWSSVYLCVHYNTPTLTRPAHSAPHLHHFLRPLLSSAASKCSKLDQKPEMECG